MREVLLFRLVLVLALLSGSATQAAAQWPRPVPPGGVAGYPSFFPDGQRIAFAFVPGPDSVSQLHSIRVDGTDDRTLTAEAYHVLQAHFSPDGRRLVYRATRPTSPGGGDRSERLVSINPDGTDARVIVSVSGRADFEGWSADGKQLMVSMRVGSASDSTYIMNADGTNRRALFDGAGQWLRDGHVVQSTRSMTGAQILVRDGPTSSPRPLISEMRFQSGVASSADGRRLVVKAGSLPAMGPVGGGSVYVMNRDGSDPRKIIDDAGHVFNLSFSPDGSKVLFEDTREGNTDIYVANVDGSGERRLTAAAEDDALPSWSPDGRLILFTSGHHVWLMSADGSGKRQVR